MRQVTRFVSKAAVCVGWSLSTLAQADNSQDAPMVSDFGIRGVATYNYAAGKGSKRPQLLSTERERFNQLDPTLVIETTVFVGASCVVPKLSRAQVKEVLDGTRSIPRPERCVKPTGQLSIRLTDTQTADQTLVVSLSRFSADDRGELHIPAMMYRASVCSTATLSVTLTQGGASSTVAKRIEFSCGE
jgi:hypothetical protein